MQQKSRNKEGRPEKCRYQERAKHTQSVIFFHQISCNLTSRRQCLGGSQACSSGRRLSNGCKSQTDKQLAHTINLHLKLYAAVNKHLLTISGLSEHRYYFLGRTKRYCSWCTIHSPFDQPAIFPELVYILPVPRSNVLEIVVEEILHDAYHPTASEQWKL